MNLNVEYCCSVDELFANTCEMFDRPKGRYFIFMFSLFLCVNTPMPCVNIFSPLRCLSCLDWPCDCEIAGFAGCRVSSSSQGKPALIMTLGKKF
jgi:hypothetical protein